MSVIKLLYKRETERSIIYKDKYYDRKDRINAVLGKWSAPL